MLFVKFATRIIGRRLVKALAMAVVWKVLSRRAPVLLILLTPEWARACSVCFGDPEHPMAQGAVAGVYVMIGLIGAVLLTIAGTAVFWMIRSRQLAGQQPRVEVP